MKGWHLLAVGFSWLVAACSSPTPTATPLTVPIPIETTQWPLTPPPTTSAEVISYTVQVNDNLFSIAAKFRLAPETILWANDDLLRDNPHVLQPGMILTILPVNGIYYTWQSGDNLADVARRFGMEPQAILNWPGNQLDPADTQPEIPLGKKIMIPGGSRLSSTDGTAYSTPELPTQYREFKTMREAQQVAGFAIAEPTYLPADLPLYKAWVTDYANGDQNVRLLYTVPSTIPLDANQKMVDVQFTRTDRPVSLDAVTHQFKTMALDVREVQVRAQTGYVYWTQSGAGGNSALLVWREGSLNVNIALHGDWPHPTEDKPHDLDPLLLKIAESLPLRSAWLDRVTDFPLAVNNTWVYQATRYEAVPITEMMTTTFIVTETVVEMTRTSGYLVIKIHRDESAERPVFVPAGREGELRPAAVSDYWLVVSGNRVYRQDKSLDLSNVSNTGTLEFVFPLKTGDKWHSNDTAAKFDPELKNDSLLRKVIKAGAVTVPAGRFENCFFLTEWIGAGTSVEKWFCPGIGLVEYRDDHHGTPFGRHQVLIKYHLAAADEKPSTLATGLTVEEHALKAKPQLDPLEFEPEQGAAAEVLKKHRADRQVTAQRLKANNELLKSFGFHIDGNTLYHDNEPVLQNMDGFGPVSVNASDSDFLMRADVLTGTVLVRKNVLMRWDSLDQSMGYSTPQFLGDDALIATEAYTNVGGEVKGQVQVSRADEIIFTIAVGRPGTSPALRGLWTHEGHWILEVMGQIIQDGQSLNEVHGYDETFGFQLLHGKPFYFFKRGQAIGISYNTQEILLGYSEVPHYGCCSPGELNPVSAENIVAFFAQRDGQWYYVEAGVFD